MAYLTSLLWLLTIALMALALAVGVETYRLVTADEYRVTQTHVFVLIGFVTVAFAFASGVAERGRLRKASPPEAAADSS